MSATSRHPLGMRVSWLLTALVQLALPGAAAWADARLDIAGAHATSHFESHTSQSCARIHAPDCAVCHFLTAPALTAHPSPLLLDVADGAPMRVVAAIDLPQSLARLHPQPRAPPTLS